MTEVNSALQERNRQFQRVYQFALTTLEHMEETLSRNAERSELMTYIGQMKEQLARILTD